MPLEHFGTPCELPSGLLVGDCYACGGEMYEHEVTKCKGCDKEIHIGCQKECAQCGHKGCKSCLKENMKFVAEWTCGDDCEEAFNNDNKEIL